MGHILAHVVAYTADLRGFVYLEIGGTGAGRGTGQDQNPAPCAMHLKIVFFLLFAFAAHDDDSDQHQRQNACDQLDCTLCHSFAPCFRTGSIKQFDRRMPVYEGRIPSAARIIEVLWNLGTLRLIA